MSIDKPFGLVQSLMGETTPDASSRETRPTHWLPKTALLHRFASTHSYGYKNLCKSTQITFKIFILADVLRKAGKNENPGFSNKRESRFL
ncbi:hypothetical protein PI95_019105 [Hassallia byssoidea VB512170]|uniref:Uncharacterized protein n=1 Tax=Hassallia byssoidea VB512170 TaxID=1304833 RepID=A0A846HB79_9CYAN|nr:hypothetical protein [Hassalia byssoidea]NEU74606.1 hypothetical protein [Hassalia byssoidea VB512170]